ncbi:MAG: hypothetical protein J0L88_14365, partial [Xanthomonadales bacterium]|nr:hypothetical protein [Xanthomonadales bacterium]
MQVRRCAHVFIEPRESLGFDLAGLLSGETGLVHEREWIALAAHLDDEIVLDEAAVVLLGQLSADRWQPLDALRAAHGAAPVDALLASGLLIGDEGSDPVLRTLRSSRTGARPGGLGAVERGGRAEPAPRRHV